MRGSSKLLIGLATIVVLLAAGAAGVALGKPAAPYTPMTAPNIRIGPLLQPVAESLANAAQLRLGQYLVRVGDCASCHTRDGGPFLSGGFALNTPFGKIYSTNLTSDAETGVGAFTPETFYAALHDGTGSDGQPLYPAMPYPYTTRVTREDSDAMLAFLKTVPPVHERRPENELSFPFNIRTLVHGWNLMFFHAGEFKPDSARSIEWNRGAYLVEGLGHCGACHTPKNALAGDSTERPLQGGSLDNGVAPDLTANLRTGLGSWRAEDIVEYLKTGRNAFANAGSSMAEVVTYSTSLLSDADLHAIAIYLKERPASVDATSADADAAAMQRGAALYLDSCTGCHAEGGVGEPRFFPPLGRNGVAQQNDPSGLLHIILAGDRTATTATRPSPLTMPAFAWKLDDQQTADVATYLRNSWGNRASPVTRQQVAELRKRLLLDQERLVDGSTDR
jgi:mono/diheme cytochrome c family protein